MTIQLPNAHEIVLARLHSTPPRPPFYVRVGPPALLEDIKHLRIKFCLPEAVALWLERCSFASAGWTWLFGTGEGSDLTIASYMMGGFYELDQIPVAGDNLGYKYCVNSFEAPRRNRTWPGVFLMDAENVNEFVCHISTSFDRFLLMWSQAVLDNYMDWWHDRSFILRHDPDIESMPGHSPSWDLGDIGPEGEDMLRAGEEAYEEYLRKQEERRARKDEENRFQ